MSNEIITRTLRLQAWERAKGEMEGVLHTYWSSTDQIDGKKFDEKCQEFIDYVENNGLVH